MNKSSLESLNQGGRIVSVSTSQESSPGSLAMTYGMSPLYSKKVLKQKYLMSSTNKPVLKDTRISDNDLSRLERKVERLK